MFWNRTTSNWRKRLAKVGTSASTFQNFGGGQQFRGRPCRRKNASLVCCRFCGTFCRSHAPHQRDIAVPDRLAPSLSPLRLGGPPGRSGSVPAGANSCWPLLPSLCAAQIGTSSSSPGSAHPHSLLSVTCPRYESHLPSPHRNPLDDNFCSFYKIISHSKASNWSYFSQSSAKGARP